MSDPSVGAEAGLADRANDHFHACVGRAEPLEKSEAARAVAQNF